MKYLTVPRLQKLSAMMQAVDVGDRIIHARVEAYSCKLAGADKRAAKEITHAVECELSHPPAPHLAHLSSNSMTPLGDLREPSTRQLLVSLITTLNASYPDYDFSDLRAEDFQREESAQATINAVNNLFVNAMEVALGVTGFRAELWSALEETMFLHECEIYKYEASSEHDDESAGKLWALNLFFFHRKQKKMLLLSGEAISKLHLQNAHKYAYQQHARRTAHAQQAGGHTASSMGLDDDDAFDSDDSDSEDDARLHHAGGALSSAEQAQQDADDDAMEAAEDEMLDQLAAENGERGPAQKQRAGSYVDASLLEWEQPLDQGVPAPVHDSAHNLAPPYLSSPSASSIASSASTVRVIPMTAEAAPSSAVLTPVHASVRVPSPQLGALHSPQIRLASTRSPNMRPAQPGAAPMHQLGALGGTLPPRGPQGVSLFGGSHSSFSAPSGSSSSSSAHPLPAVPMFTSS